MPLSLDAVRQELDAALAGAEPGIEAANELCAACVGLLGIDGAAVSMVHEGAPWWTVGSSNETSRRLDEYQFTFGEGPCLDAVATREAVLVPDLDAPREQRWPAFTGAVLDDGIHGVFALPVMVTSDCVGALDFFRAAPGPLRGVQLAGALLAAEMATQPLVTLLGDRGDQDSSGEPAAGLLEIDRIEVYQATGMLIAQLDVDADEALLRLRAHAVATGQTASQVAWAILERGLRLERDDDGGPGRSER